MWRIYCIQEVLTNMKETQREKSTISPSEYDYYRKNSMPCSQKILKQQKLPWNSILKNVGIQKNLYRSALAKLSHSLHLLDKMIIKQLYLGWEEKSFVVSAKKSPWYEAK